MSMPPRTGHWPPGPQPTPSAAQGTATQGTDQPAVSAAGSISPGRSPQPEPGSGHLPAQFDPSVAHPARVYTYWLGGKDHYPADRAAGEEVMRLRPEVVAAARANRAFGCRVTGLAAGSLGIRQFLDIGAGLPAPGPTHEVAQNASPACKVVYADNDPLVLAHGRALTKTRPGSPPCTWLHGDIRDPGTILERAAAVLDFTRPVAVLLLALLHFVPDHEDPAGIVEELAGALAPGSLIALTHLTGDFAPQAISDSSKAYNARVPVRVYPRTREQVTALCKGPSIEWPGVVPVNHWWPSLRETLGGALDLHAAVIRIPRPEPDSSSTARQARISPASEAGEDGALARAAARFPGHRILREYTGAGVAYIAQARDLRTRPYSVMASSLERLCTQLDPTSPPTT